MQFELVKSTKLGLRSVAYIYDSTFTFSITLNSDARSYHLTKEAVPSIH